MDHRSQQGKGAPRHAHVTQEDRARFAAEAAHYARSDAHYSAKTNHRMSRGGKIALGIAIALLSLVLIAAIAVAVYIFVLSGKMQPSSTLPAPGEPVAEISFDEPFYMMLIGSDERVDDESMGARTDTNIVARIDAPNNTVTLISIPRDTMIQLDGHGTQKFNAAFAFGGVTSTIEEAEDLLGVDIPYYAIVSFDGLVDLVDSVGGVEVEVRERIDDPDAGDVVIEKGVQHLDGEAALVFARSRAYADGDFTRASNQRLLIEAIVEKMLSLNPVELAGAALEAADCITTNMSVQNIAALATQFQSLGDITMYSCMVPSTTGWVGGVAYVFADEQGLAKVMKAVEAGEDPSLVETTGAKGSTYDEVEGEEGAEGETTRSGTGSSATSGSGSQSQNGASAGGVSGGSPSRQAA